jgi:replicative DNA helicase
VAVAAARAGQLDAAKAALEAALLAAAKIEDPRRTSWVYGVVSNAATEAGLLDEALAAAAKITDPENASAAYKVVAEAATRAGRLDVAKAAVNAALAAAAKIIALMEAHQAYVRVAEMAAKAGQLDAAKAALHSALVVVENFTESLRHPGVSENANKQVAVAAAKAGLLDDALMVAAKRPSAGAEAYEAVVEAAQLNAGKTALDAALAAAAKIEDPELGSWAYAAVAGIAAKAGEVRFATHAEAAISSRLPAPKSYSRRVVAEALARAGQFYAARLECDKCMELDKLKAYTVILREYITRRSPMTPLAR